MSLSTSKAKRMVVIGGVAAGTSAASKAKRIDPDVNVKIIQDESVVSCGACGIPYVLGGIVNKFEELIERLPTCSKADME
jgi:NADPH-dependent 2,4-dienoyl-CoA reductase/sulfur reductase-like enzyme